MQAASRLIGLVGEFAAGVQLGQDHLDPGDFLLRMQVHRHAATIIDHGQRIVGMQDHADLAGMTGNRLIHTIVDDFLRQVIGARGVGIHTGAFFDRIQAGQDFDG